MAAKKSRLGRGLDALIGSTELASPSVESKPKASAKKPAPAPQEIKNTIAVHELQRGRYQPRTRMDDKALEELASSIKSQGIIQPILIRQTASGQYEIVAGERRWRAAQLAGLSEVPVVIRQIPDDAAMAVALIENIQREDLNPIEEAAGLRRLLDEFELTHQEVAEKVGRSRTSVSNLLRLLNLDINVREHLESGNVEMGHARALLSLPKEQQESACETVISKNLSVRQTEQLVRSMLSPSPAKPVVKPEKNSDVRRLEDQLSEHLGTSVTISHKGKKGQIVVDFHSFDELDGILEKINH